MNSAQISAERRPNPLPAQAAVVPAEPGVIHKQRRLSLDPGKKEAKSFFPRLGDGICAVVQRVWRFLTCRPMRSSRPEFSRQNSATPLLPAQPEIDVSMSPKKLLRIFSDTWKSAVSAARREHLGQLPQELNTKMHGLNTAFDRLHREKCEAQMSNLPIDKKEAAAKFWEINLEASFTILRNGANPPFTTAYFGWMKTVCDTANAELGEKLGVPKSVQEMLSESLIENVVRTKTALLSDADACFARIIEPSKNALALDLRDSLKERYCGTFISFATAFLSDKKTVSFSLKEAIWTAHGLAVASIKPDLLDKDGSERISEIKMRQGDSAISRHFNITDSDKESAKDKISRKYGGLRH